LARRRNLKGCINNQIDTVRDISLVEKQLSEMSTSEKQIPTSDTASDSGTLHNELGKRKSVTEKPPGTDSRRASEIEHESDTIALDPEAPVTFDRRRERALLRKMDLRLLPIVTLLYLMCFLDRGNIGNARLAGLEEDLGLVGNQYAWALTVFFFSYAAFEIPSNLLLKKLRPSIWLPSIMVAWGTVMTFVPSRISN
jgi:hypothetical protein